MIILGIDTALRCTGYGVINAENGEFEIIDCGVIKNNKTLPQSQCLLRLFGGIKELRSTYKIDAAAIEGSFYCKNVKTTMILGYARGAVMVALAEANIPTYVYSPKEIKLCSGGFGNASKDQVAAIMSSMLNIDAENINLDATDALGLAVCHANKIMRVEAEVWSSKPI